MYYYLLTIKYFGKNYYGWQVQSGSEFKTIQGEIEKCLKTLGLLDFKFLGASRTDRGVHALCQLAKLESQIELGPSQWLYRLNRLLPSDIEILSVVAARKDFHPLLSIKSKTYRYYFYQAKSEDPFLMDRAHCIPYKLDMNLVKNALKLIEGEKDFINFMCRGTPVQSTVRNIYTARLEEVGAHDGLSSREGLFYFEFKGNGFLKQMVRLLVGALIEIGRGRRTMEDLEDYLTSKNKKDRLGPVVPAKGLVLYEINPEKV
jgi:tRNA pseudouridine38-40 synthase